MRRYIRNILALIRKELLMILKDKRGRFILVMPVIVQTVLFGYVASFDLTVVKYAALDEDHSYSSQQLLSQFDLNTVFRRVLNLQNSSQIANVLDTKQAQLVVYIPQDFQSRLNAGDEAPVQILTDARNTNVSGAAASYASTIIQTFNQNRTGETSVYEITPRVWFNPNLETRWTILTALSFLLSFLQVLILSAQSVAREKESGTFDQLLVTPLDSMSILIGKAIPAIIVGLVQSTLILLVAVFWFEIPFRGSLSWFYLGLLIFNFSVVGIGLCVSAFCKTMQQAMLYCFVLLMPIILLSGFVTPVSSMPEVLQKLVMINPAMYAIEFAREVFLQGLSPAETHHLLYPIIAIALVSLGLACRFFRTRLS